MTPLEGALERGYSVFPVGLDKKPLGGMQWGPYQRVRATREQIERWQRMNPPSWAVVTGALSGIVIIDFDGIDGRLFAVMNRLRPHVQTPSGGFHLWVKHPGWHVQTLNSKAKASLGKLFPGVDIRADGGYALFTGRAWKPARPGIGEYQWLREMEPDPLETVPERMLDALGLLTPRQARRKPNERQAKVATAPRNPSDLAEALIRRAVDIARSDGRNNAAFWLGIQARDNGFTLADSHIIRRYRSLTGSTNKKGEREPFTEHEALAAWRSAYNHPAREPWTRRRTS